MTERDSDIEFDFFDEAETREAAATQRVQRRGPRRPVRPPTGLTPLLRLVGLIAFAILIVVLFVFWVNSCRGASKRNSYKSYMERAGLIARDSDAIGGQLSQKLTTPGIKQAALAQDLAGLATAEQQLVDRAQRLDPPGPLRSQQQHVVESLQFRVSGLRGLAGTFAQTAQAKETSGPARLLASQSQRLVASDVVWDDLFKEPARQELKNQGIGGVAVPDSNFLSPNSDLGSVRSWTQVLGRLRGASTTGTPGGKHGNGLVAVKVLPSGKLLSTSTDNTVVATTNLAFAVTIENSGGSQEVQVPVVLTIQKSGAPIVRRQIVGSINPGEQKTVIFRDLGQPPFGPRTPVKVEVSRVKGETNVSNNAATYPVFFSVVPP